MTKFIAEDSFWELFPDAALGIIVAEGVKPASEAAPEDVAAAQAFLKEANTEADKYLTSNVISENAPVKAWREAYRKFKTKKGARCSIENLLKRVLKGNPVGSINPLVDISNGISLKYAVPIGGEDLHAFVGDLRLGITEGGDAFRGLGEDKDEPTLAGELCYRDEAGAVCRCWNWRDGERTAIEDDTSACFFVIECVEPERIADTQAAIDELARLLTEHLGADIVVKELVTRENPEIALSGEAQ